MGSPVQMPWVTARPVGTYLHGMASVVGVCRVTQRIAGRVAEHKPGDDSHRSLDILNAVTGRIFRSTPHPAIPNQITIVDNLLPDAVLFFDCQRSEPIQVYFISSHHFFLTVLPTYRMQVEWFSDKDS